jgi:hypothetical protein
VSVEIWVVSSALGLIASVYGFIEAIKDLQALRDTQNGRRLVAKQRLFAQTVRSIGFAGWLLVGLTTLAAGVAPRLSTTLIVLVLGNVLFMSVAISDIYVGWKLRRGA